MLREPDRFAAISAEMSNCPSGQHGGNLGQIGRGATVPEFERAIFRLGPTGLLRELVKTRHGFHIVAIDRRIPGKRLPFDMVRDQIAECLRAMVEEKALRQYISVLAGKASIQGANLNGTEVPSRSIKQLGRLAQQSWVVAEIGQEQGAACLEN